MGEMWPLTAELASGSEEAAGEGCGDHVEIDEIAEAHPQVTAERDSGQPGKGKANLRGEHHGRQHSAAMTARHELPISRLSLAKASSGFSR